MLNVIELAQPESGVMLNQYTTDGVDPGITMPSEEKPTSATGPAQSTVFKRSPSKAQIADPDAKNIEYLRGLRFWAVTTLYVRNVDD